MTGLRQGELLALRWRDVDWPAGRMRVRRSYGAASSARRRAGASTRAVPMADRVAAELERHSSGAASRPTTTSSSAIPQTGRPLRPLASCRKRFKAALQRRRVRDVRFHDLRHTFGTQMAAAGAPLRTIQEWMGHSDYTTT